MFVYGRIAASDTLQVTASQLAAGGMGAVADSPVQPRPALPCPAVAEVAYALNSDCVAYCITDAFH